MSNIHLLYRAPTKAEMRQFYALLESRPESECISHHKMPTWNQHVSYWEKIRSKWKVAIVQIDGITKGYAYMTDRDEIGIQVGISVSPWDWAEIAKQFAGELGKSTVYFNIAPFDDYRSGIMSDMRAKLIQETFKLTLPAPGSSTCAR